ncbi:MAG: hypothetical protein QUS13_07200 [Smithella sp.]|nr:hypothetical protein [Smithella sp.]
MFNITDINLDNFHCISPRDITDTAPADNKDDKIDFSKISDSTSVADVIQFTNRYTLIDNVGIFADINDFLNVPVPQSEADKKFMTDIGLMLLNDFNRMFNIAENGVDAMFTKYSIFRGQILIQLKKLVKRAGQSWDQWATINVPFLSQRTRIDNMRMAYRQDCYDYYPLGSERLLMLIRATEEIKGENKISIFMQKHGITFNPESRDQLKKFKLMVDAALNTEKLAKVNVTAEPQMVKTLSQYVPIMDNNFLMNTKRINESNGDVNKYFESLIINKGKEKTPFEINKAVADLNSLGVKVIQVIDFILKNEDAIETIDPKIIKALGVKISELKTFANVQ